MTLPLIVTLEGSPTHLWGLSKLFDGSDAERTLVKAKEPTLDFQYAKLTSDVLFAPSFTELDGVWEAANALLLQMNGIARLVDETYSPVALLSIEHIGEKSIFMHAQDGHHPSRLQHLPPSSHADFIEAVLPLARKSPAVRFVLEALNLPDTWASLYVIYETIKNSMSDEDFEALLSKAQAREFTKAANNSRVATVSRHGFRDEKVETINLHAGRGIIRPMVGRWLNGLRAPVSRV